MIKYETIPVITELITVDTLKISTDIICETYLGWEDYILNNGEVYCTIEQYNYQVKK